VHAGTSSIRRGKPRDRVAPARAQPDSDRPFYPFNREVVLVGFGPAAEGARNQTQGWCRVVHMLQMATA